MKYVVITDNRGTFGFTLGQLGLTKGNLGIRDADGTAHAYQGTEVIALMREDFAQKYEEILVELETLRNRNGH